VCQVICQLIGKFHSFRRVEVLTGTPRRRRWSDEKAAIVAESQAPGAQASEIALRYSRR
jgi:transposase-like protein